MSPASYRAAPPRVGALTLPGRRAPRATGWVRPGAAPTPGAQPDGVGEAADDGAADRADWYSATAFCRLDCARPIPSKSPARWALASAASAALMSETARSSAGLLPPPPPSAGGTGVAEELGAGAGVFDGDGDGDDDGVDPPSDALPLSVADSPAPAPNTWSSAAARVLAYPTRSP